MAGVDGLHELPVDVARLLIVAILLARERERGFEQMASWDREKSSNNVLEPDPHYGRTKNLSTIKFKSTIPIVQVLMITKYLYRYSYNEENYIYPQD